MDGNTEDSSFRDLSTKQADDDNPFVDILFESNSGILWRLSQAQLEEFSGLCVLKLKSSDAAPVIKITSQVVIVGRFGELYFGDQLRRRKEILGQKVDTEKADN